MSRVKVGDKVKSLVTQFDVVVGETYPVIDVDDTGGVYVKDNAGDSFYLMSREWEAIPEQTPLKVGDRVRIAKKVEAEDFYWNEGGMTPLIGQIGTVVRPVTFAGTYNVDVDGDDKWFYLPDSLEIVQPEQQDIYLVSGYASEFPTQEAAEDYVKSIGSNGEEYRIAKLVRTVKVARVTTVSLEVL